MGLPGDLGVERVELPGSVEQEPRSVAAARGGERDLSEHPVQPRLLERVERAESGRRQEAQRGVCRRDVELRLRCGQRPCTPPRRVRRQLGGARQERGGRRDAAAGLRTAG